MKTQLKAGSSLFLLIAAISFFLFFFRLGDRPLRNPDEGRYAGIAWRMLQNGDWVEPQIFGVDYLRKPPLFYWLTALSFKVFGQSEWSARAVPALFGIFGVFLTFWFTKNFFGERGAALTSLILLSNFWYLHVGRYLLMDMVFSFFLTAGLFLFFYATESSASNKKYFYWLSYASFGAAFLTKGPVVLVLGGISLLVYLLIVRSLVKVLKECRLFSGLIIFALIAGPWFYLISKREPEFIQLFFFHENLARYSSGQYEHQEPWYFYLIWLVILVFPWYFFPKMLRNFFSGFDHKNPEGRAKLFALTVIIAILGFYSLSKSKLPTYLLPIVPFLAILAGNGIHRLFIQSVNLKNSVLEWLFRLLLFIGITALFLAEKIQNLRGILQVNASQYVPILCAIFITASFLNLRAIRQNRTDKLFYWTVLFLTALSIVGIFMIETDMSARTNKKIAEVARPYLDQSPQIFVYDSPSPFYDFEFYLKYPVKLVGLSGELELYQGDPDDQEKMVTQDQFKELLEKPISAICLIRRSDFEGWDFKAKANLKILYQDPKKILFASHIP